MADDADSGSTPPRDVFITYATPDFPAAQAVCDALERAGLSCWMAPRDVMPGDFYGNAIVHAIDRSKDLGISEHSKPKVLASHSNRIFRSCCQRASE